jgi:hypothetical protein
VEGNTQVTVTAGDAITGGGTITLGAGGTVTLNHEDTSSQSSVNNSDGTVIQDITLDTYGHLTAITSYDLDGRYYTETESDNRFVNVTGDSMSGNLTMTGTTANIILGSNYLSGDGGDEGISIDASGNATMSGNITHKGTMISQGASYSSTWMQFDQHEHGNSLILGAGGLTTIGGGESAAQVKANVAANSEALYLASDNTGTTGAIHFVTNLQSGWASRVDALTIRGDGNVGINTTGPDRKLDVLDASNPQLRLTQTDGTVYADFQVDNTGDLVMGVAGQSNQLVLDNGGNIGVGTASPSQKLEVSGTTKLTANSTGIGTMIQQTLGGGGNPLEVHGAGDGINYGSQSSVVASNTQGRDTARIDDDTVVYYYGDSNQYHYARVCSIAGDSTVCGNNTLIRSGQNYAQYQLSVSVMDTSKVVFTSTYYQASYYYYVYTRVCDVSGTTISNCGTVNSFYSNGSVAFSEQYVSVAGLDSTHFVVGYGKASGTTFLGTARVGTVDGSNNISWGDETTFNSATIGHVDLVALSSSKVAVAYSEGANYGQAIIGDVSGTSISFGSEVTFNSGDTDEVAIDALSSSSFVVVYEDAGTSDVHSAVIGTVSGTTITIGNEYAFSTGTANPFVAGLSSDQIVVTWYGTSGYTWSALGEVSGTTITFGDAIVINAAVSQFPVVAGLTSTKFIVFYSTSGTSYARVGSTASSGSFYTSDYGAQSGVLGQATFSFGNVEQIDESRFLYHFIYNPYSSYSYYSRVCTAVGESVVCGTNASVTTAADYGRYDFSASMMGDSRVVFSWLRYVGGSPSTYYIYSRVCDVSGISISNCGTATQFYHQSYSGFSDRSISVAGLDSTNFVVAYGKAEASTYPGTARVGTIDGSNNISWGDETTFNSATTGYLAISALSSSKVVISYDESGNYGQAIIGDVSGTSISFGSEVTFNSGDTEEISIDTFDSSSFVVAYKDAGSADINTVSIGTVSGSTITMGNKRAFSATASNPEVATLESDKFIVSYYYGGSIRSIVGTVSGTTATLGSAAVVNSEGSNSYPDVAKLTSDKVAVSYKSTTPSANGFAKIGSISETTSLNKILVINNSGYLGIGTDDPTDMFTINSDSTQLFRVRSTNGTVGWNAADATLYVAKDSGTSRSINAAGSINASGADYAEYFATTDEELMPGELLAIDSGMAQYVKKTDSPYEENIVGAVSLKPAFVGNDIEWGSTTSVLVALMGQVKVRVSLENGPIEVGDRITSSAIPGSAMKATRAGWVLGTALTSLSTTTVEVAENEEIGTSTDSVLSTSTDSALDASSTDSIIEEEYFEQTTSTATSTDGYPEQYDYVTVLINPHWWAGYISGSGLLVEEFSATSTATSTDGDSSSFLQVVWNSIKSVPQLVVNGILEAKDDIVSHGVFKNIVKVSKNLVLGRTIVIDNAATAENSELEIAGEDENNFSFVTYSITSPRREIMVSGSGKLLAVSTSTSNVEAKIAFHPSFSSLISTSTPIRVILTPTSYINGNLYVSEKSIYGFTVKEVNSQDPGAEFDWIVTARLTDANLAEEVLAETEDIVTQENLEDSTSTDSAEFVCENGENRPCGADTCDLEAGECLGVCEIGVQVCEGGQWGECMGAVMPSEELCDGVDNNCNGEIDDGACGASSQESAGEPSETDASTSTDETTDASTQISEESTTTDSIIEDSTSTDTIVDSSSTDFIVEESTSTESVMETDSQEDSAETSSSTDAISEESTSADSDTGTSTDSIIETDPETSTTTDQTSTTTEQ